VGSRYCQDMPQRRTVARLLAVAALAAGANGLTPHGAGGQAAPGCAQPYAPVAVAETYPAQETLPSIDASVVDTRQALATPPIDSDGDGATDVIGSSGDDVTLVRGDGIVTLEAPGATTSTTYGVGDIDGDGRDEFAVYTDAGATDPGTYLIPGTVAPGTTTLAAAGIVFQPEGLGLVHVDDGTGRLLKVDLGGGSTDVLDGPAVLALGGGGDGDSVVPSTTYSLPLAAVADLGDSAHALVLDERVGDAIQLTVVRGTDQVVLTTAPERLVTAPSDPLGNLDVLVGPGGTFLRLEEASRSGAMAYLWSLTDPCTKLTADVADDAPTAPPAAPVAADARFTG